MKVLRSAGNVLERWPSADGGWREDIAFIVIVMVAVVGFKTWRLVTAVSDRLTHGKSAAHAPREEDRMNDYHQEHDMHAEAERGMEMLAVLIIYGVTIAIVAVGCVAVVLIGGPK